VVIKISGWVGSSRWRMTVKENVAGRDHTAGMVEMGRMERAERMEEKKTYSRELPPNRLAP
jgi:hypothetical protein